MASDLRALVISYTFPPTGGAGVARVLKLVKYLRAHGVEPAVLTVENPSVPLFDASLVRDVPEGMTVLRARTLEPGYGVKQATWSTSASAPTSLKQRALKGVVAAARQVLVPDPQILWQPGAQRALAARIARDADDVVFISGPPFSQFLLAPLARLRRGVAVVLDYRDEWSTLRQTYEMMGGLNAAAGAQLESGLLRLAHYVTTATEAFRQNLLARFPFLDPARVVAIPNGYDRDDFPAELPSPPSDRLVVTYAGTIFKLTSPRGLLGAIRRVWTTRPELAKRLDVRFLGRIVETEAPAFEGMEKLGVTRVGYVDHERVVRELAQSHLVLCLLDEVEGVERIYPAKIFELMMLGRPCLTLAPPGALADLIVKHQLGELIGPRDEERIAACLVSALQASAAGQAIPAPQPVGIERYDRRALAGEFAEVFRRARALARGEIPWPSPSRG